MVIEINAALQVCLEQGAQILNTGPMYITDFIGTTLSVEIVY